jgi:hypothetical protein
MDNFGYRTPDRLWAWTISVTVDDHNFQFGADKRMGSLHEIQEVVGICIGTYNGHDLNLLSEVTGKFNRDKLRFEGKATIANDLPDSDYDIDKSTIREGDISVVQTRQREFTVFAT